MSDLHRTQVGEFKVKNAQKIENLLMEDINGKIIKL